ncbi:MAG TPA: cupin domain-containing protein [Pantanalinema sp.]
MNIKNLLADLPAPAGDEVFEPLVQQADLLLERIVSTGQATPAGDWLEQERHEWVMVVSGRAALRFEGTEAQQVLEPGDYLLIPAGCRHRVEWTDANQPTTWLALHFR